METVLITGANRGLGLEFCKHYAGEGLRVIACCREPEKAAELRALRESRRNVEVHKLDVSDHAQIDQLVAKLNGTAIDILINNAGIYGSKAASLGSLDFEQMQQLFWVNTIAPLKMIEALTENVAASKKKTIVTISSKMGSIADNGSGGSYAYRSSKAAVNAVMRSAARDLAPRGICCLIMHPGWVLTDMGGPNALIDTNTSISNMCRVIAEADMSRSGGFYNYDGADIPW